MKSSQNKTALKHLLKHNSSIQSTEAYTHCLSSASWSLNVYLWTTKYWNYLTNSERTKEMCACQQDYLVCCTDVLCLQSGKLTQNTSIWLRLELHLLSHWQVNEKGNVVFSCLGREEQSFFLTISVTTIKYTATELETHSWSELFLQSYFTNTERPLHR